MFCPDLLVFTFQRSLVSGPGSFDSCDLCPRRTGRNMLILSTTQLPPWQFSLLVLRSCRYIFLLHVFTSSGFATLFVPPPHPLLVPPLQLHTASVSLCPLRSGFTPVAPQLLGQVPFGPTCCSLMGSSLSSLPQSASAWISFGWTHCTSMIWVHSP